MLKYLAPAALQCFDYSLLKPLANMESENNFSSLFNGLDFNSLMVYDHRWNFGFNPFYNGLNRSK